MQRREILALLIRPRVRGDELQPRGSELLVVGDLEGPNRDVVARLPKLLRYVVDGGVVPRRARRPVAPVGLRYLLEAAGVLQDVLRRYRGAEPLRVVRWRLLLRATGRRQGQKREEDQGLKGAA
jgi:hypothetical protein